MSDEFLYRLRREPPAEFAARLKRRLERQSAGRNDAALDRVEQLGEMPVAVVEAACRIRNPDHRPGEHLARIAHRPGEGPP